MNITMLAEIGLVDNGSIRSVFSLIGILYMIVCFVIMAVGVAKGSGFSGWMSVVVLGCVGMVIWTLISRESDSGVGWLEPRLFHESYGSNDIDKGASAYKKYLIIGDHAYYGTGRQGAGTGRDVDKLISYQSKPEVYAIHDKTFHEQYLDAPGFYISPWVFHPGCLAWSPLVVVILGLGVIGKGVRRYG